MNVPRVILIGLLCVLLGALSGCGREGNDAPQGNGAIASDNAVAAVAVMIEPAPRPDGPLEPGTSCVNDACHTSLVQARHIHQPVAEQACDMCHGPDTGLHEYPLLRPEKELCTFCHAVADIRPYQHAPVAEGQCLSCHDPHASPTKFQLKAISVERLCAQCHEVPWDRYVHAPFAQGQCSLCHDPHQANHAGLLRGAAGPDHCLGCHTERIERLANAGHVHEPVKTDCLSCHNAHTGPAVGHTAAAPQQLCASCHEPFYDQWQSHEWVHGAMTMDKACVNCHNPHLGATTALLNDREDRTCLTCHDRAMDADGRRIVSMSPVLSRTFLHGPIRAGQCSPCHDPHGAAYPSLLHDAFPSVFYSTFSLSEYELCFQCHSPELVLEAESDSVTGFRHEAQNLHYVHVNRAERGRTCKTCHDVHASNLPNHVAETVPFEGSSWAMPVGFQRTEHGGSCTPGCHATKEYQRSHTADEHEP